MPTVMVAQREAGLGKRIEQVLVREKLDVESVADGRVLLERLKVATPDLLVLDFAMPKINGMEVIEKLHERGDCIPVVMLADSKQVSTMIPKVREWGMLLDHVAKPVDAEDLLVRVQRALAGRNARRSTLQVPLRELHDQESGRIDARKVAEYLGVPLAQLAEALHANSATVHKTPAAPALQTGLRPIKRGLELVSRMTRSQADARAWLNNPHPDLGEQTPLDVILSGRAGALVTLLENALAGIPA